MNKHCSHYTTFMKGSYELSGSEENEEVQRKCQNLSIEKPNIKGDIIQAYGCDSKIFFMLEIKTFIISEIYKNLLGRQKE